MKENKKKVYVGMDVSFTKFDPKKKGRKSPCKVYGKIEHIHKNFIVVRYDAGYCECLNLKQLRYINKKKEE